MYVLNFFFDFSNAGSESNLDQCVNNNYVPTKGDPNEQGDDIQDEQVEEYPTECVNILDPSNSEINYGAHNNLEQYMEDIHEETAEDNHDIIEDNHDEITDNNHDETTKDNYYDQLAEDNHDQLAEDSHDQLAEDNHDRQLFSDEGNIFIVITANQNCDEVQEDFLNVLDGTVVTIIEEDTQSINEGDFVTELSSNESVQTLVFTPDKSPHPTPEDEQIQQTITEGTPDDIDSLPVQKKPRKRLQTPDNWKINQRKRKHQAGEEYINQKGKLIHKKEIKTKKDCLNNCKFFCNKKITCDERQAVFKAFYTLKTQNEKYMFLKNLTERSLTARKQNKGVENSVSRRQFSFRYYFNINNERIQVCKTFFLSTLSISQKPIYNVHLKKDPETDLPKNDQRGHNKSTVIPAYAKNDVRIHIKSFPVVESHYCRKNSSKQYLDSSLNISKMYSLFVEKHPDTIIKESMYRRIFLTEFNMDFHFPKSDRCDTCEEHKVSLKEKLPADSEKYQLHVAEKNAMREARHKDRENSDATVLSFDLQNVITCPRAEISSFFYFSKLNVYNLTAHLKTKNGKKVYCALWTEVTGGRTGNDIASAVYKIVKKVLLDFPETDNLITWSDSCVSSKQKSNDDGGYDADS
ncbi:uncharacterized protein LOC124371586 [Homalodisca vitripennis]|uniref:uncharacterized protein LOC124371586 n=1 Tax=Homalodisca vitripennis TaxID=197043 RepID=UPI001EECB8DB|nr:uncharacterized protein LOC124371586 [Homalodisca vitripennis]